MLSVCIKAFVAASSVVGITLLLALCWMSTVVRDQHSPLYCISVDALLLICDSVSLLLAMRAMTVWRLFVLS